MTLETKCQNIAHRRFSEAKTYGHRPLETCPFCRIEELEKERDEARRQLCHKLAFDQIFELFGPGASPKIYHDQAVEIAIRKDWDCFERNQK